MKPANVTGKGSCLWASSHPGVSKEWWHPHFSLGRKCWGKCVLYSGFTFVVHENATWSLHLTAFDLSPPLNDTWTRTLLYYCQERAQSLPHIIAVNYSEENKNKCLGINSITSRERSIPNTGHAYQENKGVISERECFSYSSIPVVITESQGRLIPEPYAVGIISWRCQGIMKG